MIRRILFIFGLVGMGLCHSGLLYGAMSSSAEAVPGDGLSLQQRADGWLERAQNFARVADYDSSTVYYQKLARLFAERDEPAARIDCLRLMAMNYELAGNDSAAVAILHQAVEVGEREWGQPHVVRVKVWYQLASIYHSYGYTAEAVGFYAAAVAMADTLAGVGARLLADLWHDYGLALTAERADERAIEAFGQAEVLYQRFVGANDSMWVDFYQRVADVCENGQRYGEAGEALQHSLTVYGRFHAEPDSIQQAWWERIATLYEKAGLFHRAVAAQRERLAIVEAIVGHAHAQTADCLLDLGSLLGSVNAHQAAIDTLQVALAVHQAVYGPQALEVGYVYDSLGFAYNGFGDNQRSLEAYQRALDIYRGHDPASLQVASTLEFLAMQVGFFVGDLDSALVLLNQSVAIKGSLVDSVSVEMANAYEGLAFLWYQKGESREAVRYYEQAKAIREALQLTDDSGMAFLYSMMAGAYSQIGQFQTALDLNLEALRIREGLYAAVHPMVATSLSNVGVSYYDLGDYEQAMVFHNRALATRRATLGEQHADVVASLFNIGDILFEKGDYEQALDRYSEALRIDQALYSDTHPHLALCYEKIGRVYRKIGDYGQAGDYFGKALRVNLQALEPGHPFLATDYENLADIAYYQQDYERALDFYQQALDVRTARLDSLHPDIARNYQMLGMVQRKLERFEAALALQERALALNRRNFGEDSGEVADIYAAIALIHDQQADFSTALAYNLKALAIRRMVFGDKSRLTANSLHNVGLVYDAMGDPDRALGYLHASLIALIPAFNDSSIYAQPTLEQLQLEPRFLTALHTKADLMRKKALYHDQTPQALIATLDLYALIVAFTDRLTNLLKSESARLLLGQNSHEVLEQAIQICLALYDKTADPAYLDSAFAYVEKSKSNILLAAINDTKAKQFGGIPADVLARERQLKIDLTFYENKVNEARDRGLGESEQARQWQEALFIRKQAHDSLMVQLEQDYPAYFELKYGGAMPGVDELQQRLLDEKTALVEYFVGDSLVYIFALTDGQIVARQFRHPEQLQLDVQRMRQGILGHDRDRYAKYAWRLYVQLWQPVAEIVAGREVVVIPDGILGYMPFEALLTADPFGNPEAMAPAYHDLPFLIKETALSYAYSASLLATTGARRERQDAASWVAYAPVFSDTTGTARVEAQRGIFGTSAAGAVLRNIGRIAPIPATETEVRRIEALFDSRQASTRSFLFDAAVERAVKDDSLANYRYIHFATHGFMNADIPELSGIIFAQDTTDTEDNVLYSSEVYNLKLNADLVVLSACETGLGKVVKGEGMIGLTRGFLYAGAANLVVSLWQVADQSTAALMIDFYEGLLAEQAKTTALRRAKLQMIDQPQYADPFFWSPFVLIGK